LCESFFDLWLYSAGRGAPELSITGEAQDTKRGAFKVFLYVLVDSGVVSEFVAVVTHSSYVVDAEEGGV